MPFEPTDYLPHAFAHRPHLGPSPEEMAEMLKVVGAESLDALIDETVPRSLRQHEPLDFGKPKSEGELLFFLGQVAKKNQVLTSLIGQGYYGTVTPPRSSATSLKTRRGIPPIPPISPRFPKAASRRF